MYIDKSKNDSIMSDSLKVCSCLPAATSILVTLGLEHLIAAATFECTIDRPHIIHSSIHNKNLSASEINELISIHKKENTTVNSIDEELLLRIQPDVLFTQAICNVCQIGEDDVLKSLSKHQLKTKMYSLNPKSLENVLEDVATVANACGNSNKGKNLILSLRGVINEIKGTLKIHQRETVNCSFFEWMDPIFNCGHWIPDQLEIAGGKDVLANPYGYSHPVNVKEIDNYNPEVLIFSACGMSLDQSLIEVKKVLEDSFWHKLSAYENKNVWIVDGDLFTQPGPDLIKGIQLLSVIFNPDIFTISNELNESYVRI